MKRLAFVLCLLCLALPAAGAEFTLTDAQGHAHRLSDYRGKWVLVNFWATWCPPCLDEIPELQRLFESRGDLMVIGVAMEYRKPQEVIDFAEKMFITYPVVLGNEKIARQIGWKSGLPTSYIYNPEGELVKIRVGPVNPPDIEQLIRGR